jgi:hypothetical protein
MDRCAKESSTRNFLHDDENRLNEEAEQWIDTAIELAADTLREQELLLLQMADYLSDHRYMSKQMVYEFLEKYAVNFDMESLVENGDHLFYRKKLKELVHKSSKKAIVGGFKSTAGILLNRQ